MFEKKRETVMIFDKNVTKLNNVVTRFNKQKVFFPVGQKYAILLYLEYLKTKFLVLCSVKSRAKYKQGYCASFC